MTQTIARSVVSHDHRVQMLPNAMAALWSRTSMLKEFWDVVQAFGAWPGAAITRGRRGLSLALDGVKVGHLDWDGRLVLSFGAEMRNELVVPMTANLGADPAEMKQATLDFRTAGDVSRALRMVRFAHSTEAQKQSVCARVATLGPGAQL